MPDSGRGPGPAGRGDGIGSSRGETESRRRDEGPRPAFRRTFRRTSAEDEAIRRTVEEELAFHLEEATEELIGEGMDPERARAEARRRFGDLEETRTYCVDQQHRRMGAGAPGRWGMGVSDVVQDVGYALRTIRKAPAYALTVMGTLAVGIAAVTVIFSVINAYFLRPLPYDDPETLVQLGHVDPRYGNWDGARFSLDMMEDYAARTSALSEMAAYVYGWRNVTGSEGPERIQGAWLTGNAFEVLGARAVLGRTLAPDEAGPAGADVVVLSHGLWTRRYGGDPGVLGRVVHLDGVPHTVVGVMAADFNFPFGGVKLWTPLRTSAAGEDRDRIRYLPVARLAPGWSPERARTELEAIQRDLAAQHPEVDGRYTGISVKPMREALNFAWEILRTALGVLMAAVLLVLAIACVNVASLTLARGQHRSRELAVRAAIGAGRGRIVRQLVVEGVTLALMGGALGVALAYQVLQALAPTLPEDLSRVGEATVDPVVLFFALAVTLATPVLFGLLPALRIASRDLAATLRGAEGSTTGLAGRRALVVAELALAVVLVSGTGLMLRSVMELQRVDVGFDPERILTVEVTPAASDYEDMAAVGAYYLEAGQALTAVPGVASVGQVYPLPLNHENILRAFAVAGRAPADPGDSPAAHWASVTPDYFEAMGIPVLAGRGFDASDEADAAAVVVISRELALRHLGSTDAVGATLLLGEDAVPATVVGVAGDVVHSGFGAGTRDLHVYRPQSQDPQRRRFLVVRTGADPRAAAGAVRRALGAVDPDLPISIRPMAEIVRESTYQWTVSSLFLGIFGTVAVLLASLGVYGLISYSVSQRRRELGVRVAMGAGTGAIRRLVLGEGLRLAAAGGLIGLAAAFGLARLARSAFYGVSPSDPATFAAVAGLFFVIALAASVLPARRAVRVDPSEALRAE